MNTELPVIDWQQALMRAGNKKELALEMFNLVIANMPNDFAQIKKSYLKQQHIDLLKQVHKLHGVICYCGFPQLKCSISQLEIILKKSQLDQLANAFDQFEKDILTLLTEAESHKLELQSIQAEEIR